MITFRFNQEQIIHDHIQYCGNDQRTKPVKDYVNEQNA